MAKVLGMYVHRISQVKGTKDTTDKQDPFTTTSIIRIIPSSQHYGSELCHGCAV